jgi:fructokinase
MSKDTEVVTMGEILIDFMGRPAGTALTDVETFVKKPGGAPANVAVGLARLEHPSAFVGMVGQDAFGDFLRRTLDEEAVDTRSLATCSDQPTTLAFVSSDENGVPSFAFYRHPGADLSLTPADINESVFEEARVFHFGSLSLVAEPAAEATRHCLKIARKKKLFVTYDPNFRPALWPNKEEAREKMLAPLGDVDLLKVSEDELRLLSQQKDLVEGCAAMMERGPGMVVVTRGEDGMLGWNSGEAVEVPPEKVDVVDTTGCGDSSMAGLIARLLECGVEVKRGAEMPLDKFEEAMRFANKCAAITATRLGAIPALPRREEVTA